MFKEALGALSTSLIGAVKDTASEYKPTAQNMGGAFTRIAQQGIANLSFRSPILADMAATMLHNFQSELVGRDTVKQYVATDKAEDLRKQVETDLGPDASKDKIDKEMFKILDKMRTLVDREGAKAAESSDTFKKYGEFFKKFQSDLKPKSERESNQQSQSGLGAGVESALESIQINTQKTVQILADMSLGEPSNKPAVGDPTQSQKPSNSFVDPYTGMPSISAAIGGIGGNFLAKVFDDETLSKYAAKAKSKLFGETVAPAPSKTDEISSLVVPEFRPKDTVKTAPAAPRQNDVASVLGDLSLDLSAPAPSKTVEAERENDAQDEVKHRGVKSLHEQTIEAIKSLEGTTKESKESSGGILSKLTDLVGARLPGMGKMGSTLATVGRAALPIAGGAVAAAGAGAAGYALGSTVVAPAIDAGISKLTGRDESLGTWLYGLMNGDEDARVAELLKPTPITAPTSATSAAIKTVATMEAKKDADTAKTTQPTTVAPVAINSSTTNNSNTNVIVGSSVRNHESTYERVQMSNIWGPI